MATMSAPTLRLASRSNSAASWLLQGTRSRTKPITVVCHATTPRTPSSRPFSSTSLREARGGPIKVSPDFSWRRPFRSMPPAPNVTLVSTDFDADAILETLTSKRIAVDGEPGLKEGVTIGDKMRTWSDGPNPVLRLRDGVFGLADGDGVILLYLAKMKRVPRKLVEILEDPNIEKETIGAPWLVRSIMDESDFFHARPMKVVCLRRLAEIGWPHAAAEPEGVRVVHDEWVLQFAEQAWGVRHAVKCRQESFHVDSLSKETLELLVNRSWFALGLGHEARQRIADRMSGKVDRDRSLLRRLADAVTPKERVKQLLVEQATEESTFDANVMDEAREYSARRKRMLEELHRRAGR